jgi:dihydrofolate reductase
MDKQHCIGVNNTLPWHLKDDLKHFKTLTQGGVILMGRKTFESLPGLLPNRTHVVLTRNTTWSHPDTHTAHTLKELISKGALLAKAQGSMQMFVIGGAELYAATLSIADVLHITHVDLDVQGDAHYPFTESFSDQFNKSCLAPQLAENDTVFQFCTYTRRDTPY